MSTSTKKCIENRVLPSGFLPSQNFYESDRMAAHYWKKYFSSQLNEYLTPKLKWIGEQAAQVMDALSLAADKYPPVLKRRNFYGEDIFEIEFHPAYWQLTGIAVRSEMFRVKWHPKLRAAFQKERHLAGFAPYFLYAMAEGGLPCPLCMTDGAARLIDRFCTEEDKQRLLPHIYTDKPEELYTGAMFLTEKSGGSDVGANLVKATPEKGDYYRLNGEKWFCSNANAQIIFALARTDEDKPGTRGLSLFLIEPTLPGGARNPMEIVRLKDKLGVRSMASAEIIMRDTLAKRIGQEGEGFKLMAEMVNLSRLYNAVAAVSFARRALIEAYQFACYRSTFGKTLIEHPLAYDKLLELAGRYQAIFYMTWRAIRALDAADNGNESEAHLARLLIPMVKRYTALEAVYIIRESMEMMGGIGYIEDGVMPKLMRDVLVLPIWEGAGNIMILDMLRATAKSNGLEVMVKEMTATFRQEGEQALPFLQQLDSLLKEMKELPGGEAGEIMAKYLFERLTQLYAVSLLMQEQSEAAPWITPALDYWKHALLKPMPCRLSACQEAHEAVAWDF
jgi:alkylation response protein AidB-like acyl-CoA dehydrogenase